MVVGYLLKRMKTNTTKAEKYEAKHRSESDVDVCGVDSNDAEVSAPHARVSSRVAMKREAKATTSDEPSESKAVEQVQHKRRAKKAKTAKKLTAAQIKLAEAEEVCFLFCPVLSFVFCFSDLFFRDRHWPRSGPDLLKP